LVKQEVHTFIEPVYHVIQRKFPSMLSVCQEGRSHRGVKTIHQKI
jgi:hypothetical protein